MIPLTLVSKSSNGEFEFRTNHFLFMTTLHCLENRMSNLTVSQIQFREDIGIEFGIKKRGALVLKRESSKRRLDIAT